MNGSHEELLDDVAAYALGALPASDAARIRAHIETCANCRVQYDELSPAVTALASSAEACKDAENGAVVASPLLKARIMREVRAEARKPAARAPQWSFLATAASIAIAIGVSLYALALNERISHLQAQIAHATESGNAQQQMLADIKNPTAKRYPIDGGEVVAVHHTLYITMVDLPAPPQGKVYQAWTLKKGAKAMSPSVTFAPDARGVALIALPVDSANTAAVALSVEPTGGSKAPTSTPVFVRTLSS